MKSTGKFIVATMIVVVVLSLGFVQAFAMPSPSMASSSANLNDPMVTISPVASAGKVQLVEQSALPGTNEKGGMFFPKGFTDGQAQFSGMGVKISGLKNGETAKVSFDFRFSNFDWRGYVYQWNGSRWVKLATTVSGGGEAVTTWANASNLGNGTYALIIFNYGVPDSEVPTEEPTTIPTFPGPD